MRMLATAAAGLSAFSLTMSAAGNDVILKSTAQATHLLELYTSEGCSSCPPAEKWFSQLKENPRLWREIVPVAFHVNYWDELGWPDHLASKMFTDRQRAYAAAWGSTTVYTPGFVLDGREWKERSSERIPAPSGNPGVLSATIRNHKNVTVIYEPGRVGFWEANVVLLAFGVNSEVRAGENRGRTLLHDFAALSHDTRTMRMEAGSARVEINLPALSGASEFGVAIWINEAGKLQPIQAVGGKL